MDEFTRQTTELLLRFGPALVALVTASETIFVTGLVVPAGPVIILATVLSLEGQLPLTGVLLAAAVGGAIGDTGGFVIGRKGGRRILEGDGAFARMARKPERKASALFGRHPLFSVTVARLISFVRTIMPLAAGMSPLRYRRFVAYDLMGVALWAVAYVSIGIFAQEGWERVSRALGVGGALTFIAGAVVLWWVAGRRVRRRRRIAVPPGPGAGAPAQAAADGMDDLLLVALTGNVASGKSAVARAWSEAGAPVVSADELARRAVEPGTEGLTEVVAAFGEGVLAPDGTLDRAALRSLVFRDAEARERLESILHPRIRELREEWLDRKRAAGEMMAISEIPLLFETGMQGDFDVVVFVDAAPEIRLKRLVGDRGLDEEEARRIMESQMDPDEKRWRADHVLVNEGTLDDLREASLALLDELRAEAAGEGS